MKQSKTLFIDGIDLTTCKDDNRHRAFSFSIGAKRPDTIQLLGSLSHNTRITFDQRNARKLIAWLKTLL